MILTNEARIEAASVLLRVSANTLRNALRDHGQALADSACREEARAAAKGEAGWLDTLNVGMLRDSAAHLAEITTQPAYMWAGDVDGSGAAWRSEIGGAA